MIAVIDYGAGNIFSVKNALDYLGFESILTDKSEDLKNADALILPGVGAFPSAMKMLEKSGLIDTIMTLNLNLFWEYVWECSFYLIRAMNLKSAAVLG